MADPFVGLTIPAGTLAVASAPPSGINEAPLTAGVLYGRGPEPAVPVRIATGLFTLQQALIGEIARFTVDYIVTATQGALVRQISGRMIAEIDQSSVTNAPRHVEVQLPGGIWNIELSGNVVHVQTGFGNSLATISLEGGTSFSTPSLSGNATLPFSLTGGEARIPMPVMTWVPLSDWLKYD